MKVEATYYKKVKVREDITEEEFNNVFKKGMPTRVDYKADVIDEKEPLHFVGIKKLK